LNNLSASLLGDVSSSTYLDAILGQLPFVFWVVDRQGVFRASRGGGLKAVGQEPGEIIGKLVQDVYPDHVEILQYHQRAMAGEEVVATVHVGDASFDATYTPLRDEAGSIIGVLGTATDVSTRVRGERQLLEMRQSLDALLDIDRATSRTSRKEEILEAGLSTATSVIGADKGAVYRLDGETLSLEAHCGLPDRTVAALANLPLGEGLVSLAIQRMEVVVVAVDEYPTEALAEMVQGDGIRQLISAPLITMGEVFGGISLGRTEERPFTQRDRDFIFAIGVQMASALRVHLLFEERECARAEADMKLKEVVALNRLFHGHVAQIREVLAKLRTAHAFSGELLDELMAGPVGEEQGESGD
jgi:PAS domain S-box-containing protein